MSETLSSFFGESNEGDLFEELEAFLHAGGEPPLNDGSDKKTRVIRTREQRFRSRDIHATIPPTPEQNQLLTEKEQELLEAQEKICAFREKLLKKINQASSSLEELYKLTQLHAELSHFAFVYSLYLFYCENMEFTVKLQYLLETLAATKIVLDSIDKYSTL